MFGGTSNFSDNSQSKVTKMRLRIWNFKCMRNTDFTGQIIEMWLVFPSPSYQPWILHHTTVHFQHGPHQARFVTHSTS